MIQRFIDAHGVPLLMLILGVAVFAIAAIGNFVINKFRS